MHIPDLGNCLQGQGSGRVINMPAFNQHGTQDCYFEVSRLSQDKTAWTALLKKRDLPLQTEIPVQ